MARPTKPIYLYCADDEQLSLHAFRLSIHSAFRVQKFATINALLLATKGNETGCIVWIRSPGDAGRARGCNPTLPLVEVLNGAPRAILSGITVSGGQYGEVLEAIKAACYRRRTYNMLNRQAMAAQARKAAA